MANLTFYYGTMKSGKTTKLLQDHYNYNKDGLKTLVAKPGIDTKGGNKIVNRQGEGLEVDLVMTPEMSFLSDELLRMYESVKYILTDESQFFTKEQINELWFIAHFLDINVISFGLKTNFMGNLFEGSSELFAKSDIKHELTVNCRCGKQAVFNARRVNGEFISKGEEVLIDGEHEFVEYIPCCSDCYLKLVTLKENPSLTRMRELL